MTCDSGVWAQFIRFLDMIDIVACFTVIGVSISLALLNELLLYIAVYRHSTYKIRKDAMERQALKGTWALSWRAY